MTALTYTQINQFSANGVQLIENAITTDELA